MIHHDAKSRLFMSTSATPAPGSLDNSRNPEEPLPPDISLCMVNIFYNFFQILRIIYL